MAIGVALNESSVAVELEVTEGTYVAEQSGASFIQPLAEGLEVTPAQEFIERNNLTDSVEKVAPRQGVRSVSGTIPVEWKAGDSLALPETDPLYKGLLGALRQISAQVTTKTGHTTTQIEIEDADIGSFAVNDVILILEAGAYHVSPITAVDTTPAAANITILVPADSAFSDNVVIEKMNLYYHDSGDPTLSITHYIGGTLREKAIGARVISGELQNFTTGQVPSFSFGFDGLDFDREDGVPLFTPSLDASLPPVVLGACIWIDGVEVQANELTLSIEKEVGFLTSTCSENGRISSRTTGITVTGSVNPYADDTTVTNYDLFRNNTTFSLFAYAYNPSATTGEFSEVSAIWLPNCKLTEFATGDQEGIATDALSFQSFRENGNDSVFLAFM